MIVVAIMLTLFPSLILVGRDLGYNCNSNYNDFCNKRLGRKIDTTEQDLEKLEEGL